MNTPIERWKKGEMNDQIVMELAEFILCQVCTGPIGDISKMHLLHRAGCVPNSIAGCDCDMYAHAECCPNCKVVTL